MQKQISSIFLLVLNYLLVETTSEIIQGYNERCELYDETSSCDPNAGLMCINVGLKGYRCKCPNDASFGTVWDGKRSKCVGKVWNSCVRAGIGNVPPSSAPFNLNDTLCVENAECSAQFYHLPICMCKKGFFEFDEGLCIPTMKYGESCDNKSAQCDSKYGLSCHPDKKVCSCKDESHQFYDPEQEKCITFVEGNCTKDDECVPNSVCSPPIRKPGGNAFIVAGNIGGGNGAFAAASGSGRVRGKRDIFFGSGERDVQQNPPEVDGYYGGGRPNNFNRPPHLPYPPHNHGPFGTGSATSGNGHNKNGPRKCLCRSEYSPTKDGFCMPSYGAECTARSLKEMRSNNSNGSNTSKEICNPDQFLECLGTGHEEHGHSKAKSKFRCQCRNPLNERFDGKSGKCVSRPGKRCRASSSYPSCEEGSECVRGVCQCGNGTTLTPSGNCRLDFNQNCSQSECNTAAGLICHGKTQTCLCLDSYLNYDPVRKSCVAERDSPCGYVDQYQTIVETGFNYYPVQQQQQQLSISSSSSRKRVEPPIFIDCENGSVCRPQGVRYMANANTNDKSVSYSCVASS